ncbi:hypothetical protein CYY_000762 [Polysphondylium violaceum]|uniref:WD40 repeat-containing protein n=1 Tax=Polysphondylium violaceum TaxID=133409 RepID=A0A8J4Q399_9MYCE|nr:hypothetical protein CYY_000762 [Polysphondylium violaceum]
MSHNYNRDHDGGEGGGGGGGRGGHHHGGGGRGGHHHGEGGDGGGGGGRGGHHHGGGERGGYHNHYYSNYHASKIVYDGKRMRKAVVRKTVDFNSTLIKYNQTKVFQRDYRDFSAVQPDSLYIREILPPLALDSNPITSICSRFIHTSANKVKYPINCVTWTPEGRRLITGSSSGEFTLWNGLTFNFETILQAHDTAVRAMVWSHNEDWMVSGDDGGLIKYWQPNMNNVKIFQAHKESVRGISFSPTDFKIASCSDDVTIKIWDFARCKEEKVITGHGWDVKCVSWHPQKSIIASGSKDNLIKMWDAKSGENITTLHGHKNTVLQVQWNQNGNWLVSASRDSLLKLFDIRTMKELQTFKAHKEVVKEMTSVAWHPQHEDLFVSGGFDGSILYWVVGQDNPQGEIYSAHEASVWSLSWHPIGHILASGSNDHTTKFWCRNRPADTMKDKYNNPHASKDIENEEDAPEVPDFILPGLSQPVTNTATSGGHSNTNTPPTANSPTLNAQQSSPTLASVNLYQPPQPHAQPQYSPPNNNNFNQFPQQSPPLNNLNQNFHPYKQPNNNINMNPMPQQPPQQLPPTFTPPPQMQKKNRKQQSNFEI